MTWIGANNLTQEEIEILVWPSLADVIVHDLVASDE